MLLIACNNKSRVHAQYQFSVIFIFVNYVYLLVNAIDLNAKSYPTYFVYTLISFIYFMIVLIIIRSNLFQSLSEIRVFSKLEHIIDVLTKDRKLIFFYFLMYISSLFLRTWMSYGESVEYRLVTSGSEQILATLPSLLLLSASPYLLVIAVVRARLFAFLPLVVLTSLISTISGSRSAIIIMLFTIYYALYTFHRIKIDIKYLVISIISFAMVIITVGHSRSGATAYENIVLFWKFIQNFKFENYNILGIGEFYWPAHSIVSVIEELPTDILLLSKELCIFVPKFIWADRPLPAAESYMNILYNDLFISGHGYGFNNAAFGYWWGGYSGLLLYGLISGCFFKIIQRIIVSYKFLGTFLFATFFFNIFHFSRGVSVIGLFKNAILLELVPILFNLAFLYVIYTVLKVNSHKTVVHSS